MTTPFNIKPRRKSRKKDSDEPPKRLWDFWSRLRKGSPFRKVYMEIKQNTNPMTNHHIKVNPIYIDDIGDFSLLSDSGIPITISSDCEGINPTSQIDKIMKAEQLIYLGDFLDYTTNYNTNKVEPEHVANENLCSLKLLQHFNDNPNVKSVLGNREFNKVKFWPLVQIKVRNKLVSWWKDDNNNNNNISDIAMKLCNMKPCDEKAEYNKNNYNWFHQDLQSFCPFWRYKPIKTADYTQGIDTEFKGKFEKHWGINPGNNSTVIPQTLKERYDYLFGADPPSGKPVGTIGAQNTHICLPRELGYTDEDLNEFMTKNKMLTSEENIDEFKAAIVFTVYARMLDISLYSSNKQHGINYSKDKNELYLDGVLANYLMTTPCVGYIHDNSVQDFYLFAHGGISLDFVNSEDVTEKFAKIAEMFKDNDNNLCKHIQNGGNNKITTKDFINRINKFNEKVSELMKNVLYNKTILYNDVDYLDSLNILMSLCVPDSVQLKETGYTSSMSPIVTGLPVKANLAEKIEIPNEHKLYTFFGHFPNGCGYGFYKLGDQQYSISTDFSSSLFTSNILFGISKKASKTYNNNNLLLKLDINNKSLNLEGDIHIEINEDFKNFNTETDETSTDETDITKLFKEKYQAGKISSNDKEIVSGVKLFHTKQLNDYKSLHIKFNDNSSIQKQLDEFNTHGENTNIVFHGNAKVTIDDHAPFKAEIFSVKNGLNKELVINETTQEDFGFQGNEFTSSGGGSRIRLSYKRNHKSSSRKSKLRRNKLKLKTRINKKRNLKHHTKRNTSKA
jgi:hypothetical protein